MERKYVVVLSGGLDSTTLLYMLKTDRKEISSCVGFNYGQRHKKELSFAQKTCETLGIKFHLIDLWSSGLTAALQASNSSLVTDAEVPEGHYAADNMKSTVVPNRNMMMLSIAGAIAVSEGASHIATGVHAGDHFIYPDCRPEFIAAASDAMYRGNFGFGNLSQTPIYAPFLYSSKEEIANMALMLGVPLDETWSCYKGGDKHCGKCGTCVERIEAIQGAIERLASLYPNNDRRVDPTEYEDAIYWKSVTA